MNSSIASYRYAGGGAGMIPYSDFTPPKASSTAVSGPSSATAAGGGSQYSTYLPSSSAATPSVAPPAAALTHKICTLSSEARDKSIYPDASKCVLSLPESVSGVTKITVTAAEIPHTSFNLLKPRLYFSEQHDDGQWYPFYAGISSGNYGIEDFTVVLGSSTLNAVSLSGEFAAPVNTYSVAYSDQWGRVCIKSNGTVPFRMQFRGAPVAVTYARINTANSKQYVDVTVSDSQKYPLLEGAFVTFAPGGGLTPVACVVEAVSNNVVSMRLVQRVVAATETASSNNPNQKYLKKTYVSLVSAFGTDVHGTVLNIAATASLLPASGFADGYDNLGDLLGYGVYTDRRSDDIGTNAVAGLQSPFHDAEGYVLITTHQPHFSTKGDIISISSSGTLLDTSYEVTKVIDETHLTIKPDYTPFIKQLAYPTSEADLTMSTFIETGFDTQGNASTLPIAFENLFAAVTLVSMQNGTFNVKASIYSLHQTQDYTQWIDKPMYFNNNDDVSFEWKYCVGKLTSIDTTDPNIVYISIKYPTYFVNVNTAVFKQVANSAFVDFDATNAYTSCRLLAPGRYDFSRRRRFMYVRMTLDGNDVGDLILPSLPRQKFFARIPLIAGQDAVSYANFLDIDGTVYFQTPISRIQDIMLTFYTPSGQQYDFAGVDYSITLELQM